MKLSSLLLIASLSLVLLNGCVTTDNNTQDTQVFKPHPASTISADVAEKVNKM
jgi:hypothetical protein